MTAGCSSCARATAHRMRGHIQLTPAMRLTDPLFTRLRRTRARMRARSRSGSAAVEFAIIAPVLFLFLFGTIETGVIYFAGTALQNATDDAARQVRTGEATGLTAAQFKALICGEISGIISTTQCTSNLQVDLRQYTDFSTANYPTVTNANGSLNTGAMSYPASLSPCQVVLVRAFYPWSIMTPLMQPLLQNMPNGQYLLSAAAAFRSEPYTSSATC
jgi:Flp pilus assembly protein TadG